MEIVNARQIKTLMGLSRHRGKAGMGRAGFGREGDLALSVGWKGLWQDQAIPLHSGERNQTLEEQELGMQLLSPTRSQDLGGNSERAECKTRWRFMTSTIPPLPVVPPWVLGHRLMEAL